MNVKTLLPTPKAVLAVCVLVVLVVAASVAGNPEPALDGRSFVGVLAAMVALAAARRVEAEQQ